MQITSPSLFNSIYDVCWHILETQVFMCQAFEEVLFKKFFIYFKAFNAVLCIFS